METIKRSYWGFVWRGFRRSKAAVASLCLILFFFLLAVTAPLIANNKPYIYVENGSAYFPLFVTYEKFSQTDFRKAPGFKIMRIGAMTPLGIGSKPDCWGSAS